MDMKQYASIAVMIIVALTVLFIPALWAITQLSLHHVPRLANVYYGDESPADHDIEYEDVSIISADGTQLSGWYMPGTNGAAIVTVHGYRSVKTRTLPMVVPLHEAGYTMLAIDLRGHGDSEGLEVSFGIHEQEDVDAAVAWLMAQPEVDPTRIGVLGESMGGATVILAAADNPDIQAVATHSAFSSLRETIYTNGSRYLYGLSLPIADMMFRIGEEELAASPDDYAPIDVVGQISPRPIFIMHGGQDPTVDPKSGHQLYAAAGEPKELWYEPSLEHIEFPQQRPQEFGRRIVAFFDTALLIK